ncbi:hypothetical protein [Arthrobacter sp. NPDC090010]|uniref:hypothetical protein n=1 Tax=Arthrobacter sp. NPDC090010 TaxID=3363942 RepID=UPI0037F81D48
MTTETSWNLSVTRPPKPRFDAHTLENHVLSDGEGLPPSYVSFVQAFGWGRLFGLWLVYTPVPLGHADGLLGRGGRLTARLREEFGQWQNEGYDWAVKPDGSWETPQRLEVFAMSENGDYLAWDTGSRDPHGEVQIYHTSRFSSLTRIGGDLHEAVEALRVRDAGATPPAADFDPLDLSAL